MDGRVREWESKQTLKAGELFIKCNFDENKVFPKYYKFYLHHSKYYNNSIWIVLRPGIICSLCWNRVTGGSKI